MKKIISIICTTLLLFIFTNSVSLALPTPKEIKNFAIYENELNKTTEGQDYVKAIDIFIRKNWNNRVYLQDLRTNINAIAKSSTIKDNFSKIVLQYLDAKIGIILQYPTTSITSFSTSGTGSTTTDNTSTGSISSTGSTSSTGVVAERVSGDKLTKEQYERLIDGTYFLLTNNANFSFMEYIDLECPSCAKLHNDGIIESIKNQYGVLIDYRIIHFPLPSHSNAQMAAEIAECLGNQKGASAFYRFIEDTFRIGKTDKETLINQALSMGADKEKLNKCVEEGTFRDLVQYQKWLGEQMLGINSTPSVVIRNNNSGKFVIVSGLHSLEDYQKALESLYK